MTAPCAARLYGAEFAAAPQAVYNHLRQQFGPVAPVEIAPGVPAHLVIGYRAALDVLTGDTDTWSKDSRAWMATLPDTSEARALAGMLAYRRNPLFTDGLLHARYRRVISDVFRMVEPHLLRTLVTEVADSLIRDFARTGQADLVTDFARPIPLRIFNRLYGRPDQDSAALSEALNAMVDSQGESAARGNEAFTRYMTDLIRSKYAQPRQDLTSWIITHPAELDQEEVRDNVVLSLGAANEPLGNLISNTISRMLADDRYYSTLTNGAMGVREALLEVLRDEPPMANYGPYFVRRPTELDGVRIRPTELVLVSYAAANTSPCDLPDGPRSDGGAHLAFGAGAHRCPAIDPAMLIAATAIERLILHLCDLELSVPRTSLQWRPGPFHRALAHLPVKYTPIRPDQAGVTPWSSV